MTEANRPGIIVISGPSGSGKGTIISKLPENYVKSISVTTRNKREGERQGEHYFFVNSSEFDEMVNRGEILEYNFYDGNYYGTPRSQIKKILDSGKNAVLDVDVNGALRIKEAYPNAIMIFLMSPNVTIQEKRLRDRRANDEDSIRNRIRETGKELCQADKFDCVIINDEGKQQEAVDAILKFLSGERSDSLCCIPHVNKYFDCT